MHLNGLNGWLPKWSRSELHINTYACRSNIIVYLVFTLPLTMGLMFTADVFLVCFDMKNGTECSRKRGSGYINKKAT